MIVRRCTRARSSTLFPVSRGPSSVYRLGRHVAHSGFFVMRCKNNKESRRLTSPNETPARAGATMTHSQRAPAQPSLSQVCGKSFIQSEQIWINRQQDVRSWLLACSRLACFPSARWVRQPNHYCRCRRRRAVRKLRQYRGSRPTRVRR